MKASKLAIALIFASAHAHAQENELSNGPVLKWETTCSEDRVTLERSCKSNYRHDGAWATVYATKAVGYCLALGYNNHPGKTANARVEGFEPFTWTDQLICGTKALSVMEDMTKSKSMVYRTHKWPNETQTGDVDLTDFPLAYEELKRAAANGYTQ